MTEPTGGPPPVPDPASAPPPAAPVAPAAAPAAAPSAWQAPAPAVAPAGPAPGVAYAGLGIRIVALIIDAILLGILTSFVWIILGALFTASIINDNVVIALLAGVVLSIASMAISAAYFIWGWTKADMRASLGQRVVGLNTLSATDGATITRPQAVRRWVFLFGIVSVAQSLQLALGTTSLGTLASLLGLLAFAYEIFLLWTTYQSPKKQGYHDVQAGTVVVKKA